MRGLGRLHAVGVEGTGSYGAALTRHLRRQQVKVVEVNRPDRRQRRAKGKSDPLDAYAAADAVLADRATAVPKAGDGIVESIRALHLVRAGAVKARTACINELQALVVTAPAELRGKLAGYRGGPLAEACSRLQTAGDLIKQGWSPQQMAGRLPIDHPGDQHVRASHEAIYGWIYAVPKGELARECLALRSGRTRRRPAHGRAPRAPRIRGIRWIDDRPADAVDRQVPGHWEGDLVIGKDGRTAVGTLVERVSRFVVLVPLAGRDAATVSEAVIDQVQGLPDVVRRSLTWDCGSEMAEHAAITLKARLPVYFAHPHSPWERGTNENTNRWLREYFPKGTIITNDPELSAGRR